MLYPTLNSQDSTREVISSFGGYHHHLRIGEGELYDMENLTSAQYPLLATRSPRGVYASPIDPQGLIAKDALCYVDGATLYVNRAPVEGLVLDTTEKFQPKTLLSMGAYLLIFPDRVYVNCENLSDHGKIDARKDIDLSVAAMTFSPCNIDGEIYGISHTGDSAPDNPKNGDYWLDDSASTLYQYASASASWVAVSATYVKIEYPEIGKAFSLYDGITVSGITEPALSFLNGSHVIWGLGDGYLVLDGMLKEPIPLTAGGTISFAREMPLFDYITEAGNRLWACHYGKAANGEIVNEIYASKLGDFKNWNCFMGLSTDSYAASLGSDGAFTGAVTHLGHPIFFKENCLHKIYGEIPSNFQIQTTACRGVQKGSARSLAIVNGILYYKGLSSVLAYDGSLPQELGDVFGEERYHGAVGCAHGNRYYLSMADRKGRYHLFVYDSARGLWHREDSTEVLAFCSLDDELYFVDASDKKIKTAGGSGDIGERAVPWMAETGLVGTDSSFHKYLSRLVIRMSLSVGASVRAYIEYDSSGHWEYAGAMTGKTLDSFSLPIRPRRCDHLRLKLTGTGEAKIHSLTKIIEEGSDRL